MVKISLEMKMHMENVEEIKTCGKDFQWYLKFACSNCGEKSDKWNYLSLAEEVPAEHGKDVYHFLCKCKLCSRVNTVNIIKDTISTYTSDDSGKFKQIVVFDCRGLEPYDFHARDGWIVKPTDGGKTFQDVDLSDGEWVDYCVKNNCPVLISEIEKKFERIK